MVGSRGVLALCAAVLAMLVLAATAGAGVAGGSARGAVPLSRTLQRALTVPHAPLARSGALAVDLADGSVLYALNADRPFVPASNEKLTVAFAALQRLGASYRFRTTVLGTGERVGATWRGTLYLHGGGDPTLELWGLRRLARALRADGIRRVTGGVLADESLFDTMRTAPGWRPGFYMNESPPLSALVVNRAIYRRRMTPDPAGAAAASFVRILRAGGVAVAGDSGWGTAPEGAFPLAELRSEPLATVLKAMDGDSDNFTAELLLKTLGAEVAGEGTTAAGARVVRSALAEAGIPLAGVRIVDGSGLSRLDRLTPRALAAILVALWNDPELRGTLWDSLAVAGRSGTLAHRLDRRPAVGAVRAKTGTTAVASALSGFVRRRYAFAVVQNGRPVSWFWARKAQDRFVLALASQPTP